MSTLLQQHKCSMNYSSRYALFIVLILSGLFLGCEQKNSQPKAKNLDYQCPKLIAGLVAVVVPFIHAEQPEMAQKLVLKLEAWLNEIDEKAYYTRSLMLFSLSLYQQRYAFTAYGELTALWQQSAVQP